MLTGTLFEAFTDLGAEWVLWALIALSIASVALVLERAIFYARNGRSDADRLAPLLADGRLAEARAHLEGRRGFEAAVLLAALDAAPMGAAAVEEVIAGAVARARQPFEKGLSFLGTLGNNAPFLGLFGTVVGIIQAFAELAVGTPGAAGAASVMGGISEALVATAVGIFVAIPAVVAFNGFNRRLKTIVAGAAACGHALSAHLRRETAPERPVRAAA
jgi:biopolymer transport protein ExbB/TolQ